MIRIFASFIAIFFISFSNAQITDSIQKEVVLDTVLNTRSLDTTKVDVKKDSLKMESSERVQKMVESEIVSNSDSLKIDTIQKIKMITIKKSLLDSLLKPYYRISMDTLSIITIKNDTVMNDTVIYDTKYIHRYRRRINRFTKDTSYVIMPTKEEKKITAKNEFSIDYIEIKNPIKKVKINRINYVRDTAWWENKNSIGLDINQIAFVNWSAGGNNSISGLLKGYFGVTYKKSLTIWHNEISIRYGLNKQQERELRKTDDHFKVNSTFGYRTNVLSDWYYSAKFNFNTQFTNGYKYPNTDDPISRLFAPAYLFLGAGAQYYNEEKRFTIFLSPLTLKSTFVFDKKLSDNGDFGVEPGQRSRHEFGTMIQTSWETEIFDNVAMINRLGLYSDYLNNFGNIDVNWELKFKFKINKFLEASIATDVVYDDDIKYKEDRNGDGQLETFGARVQFKQQVGVGFLYKF